MQAFEFVRASNAGDALSAIQQIPAHVTGRPENAGTRSAADLAGRPPVRFLAGGTTLVDLMKLDVETPLRVVDINQLPYNQIETLADGRVRVGAVVRNADMANHALIRERYPTLSLALKSGASAQLRNVATTGGNLLQRTRCMYFRDTASACNKRAPGSGCAAIGGFNRNLAVLGTSEHCIASNPSDMNVALTALEAVVSLNGPNGARDVPVNDFYLLPGTTPERETVIQPGELITHVTLPAALPGSRGTYLKLRDRASYEFALASAAIVVRLRADGSIDQARVALGGVGTRPWRATPAERVLQGAMPDTATFRRAAEAALAEARPQTQNGFKIELSRKCIVHALQTAMEAPAYAA